ncbi:MAG: lytic transglycosylase domain-containing protein [Sideroxyarcus sp.]
MIPNPVTQIAVVPEAYTGKPLSNIADKIIYDRMVDRIALTYGLESALLHAVISVESRYSPKAVSKAGAIGLMQLMPETARQYGVADPLDPLQNLRGGARYLRYLLKKYNNDRHLALAAYNAGEASVAKYGNKIPPYPETTSYVPRVMGYYRKYLVKI